MKATAWLPHVLSATALTATVTLCIVGCGDERPDSPAAGVSASPTADGSLHPGTFRATLPGGASVRITLPSPGVPDRRLDALRREAKVSRATYATVAIDNRHGGSPVSVSRLILRAEDGATYQLEHVSRAVEKWKPRVRDDEFRARDGSGLSAEAARNLKSRLQEAGGSASKDVPVGQRGSNILVGDISAVPESFESLELIPKIGDREVAPVRAHPEGGSGSPDSSGGSSGAEGGNEAGDAPAPDSTDLPEGPGGAMDEHNDPAPSSEPSAADPPVAPVDPVDPVVPVDPEPVDPNPVDPRPVDPVPVDPNPVDPGPVDPGPVDPGPVVPDPRPTDPVVPDPGVTQPVEPDPPELGVVDPETPGAAPTDPVVTDPVLPALEQSAPAADVQGAVVAAPASPAAGLSGSGSPSPRGKTPGAASPGPGGPVKGSRMP